MVENFFSWYFVESLLVYHEVTHTLAEVTDLDADIYRRKALLAHRPMIIIVSGYTLAIESSMENPDQMEWVPTSLCENPRLSLPKESVPVLRDLVLIWEVMIYPDHVHWCVTCCSWV